MHSYYSAKHQPFLYYNYTIFVAEVASTFNEQLLSARMLAAAGDERQRAYLINREVDGIRGTIVRQTMFAEFEKITHEMAEAGEPLTVQALKDVYRGLLADYFGPDFVLDDELSLECLRIPHFYRAFYVYKYATGLSAAISLAQRVLDRWREPVAGLSGVPESGMLPRSARSAPRCRSRHGEPAAGGDRAATLRATRARIGRADLRRTVPPSS